MSFRKSKVLAVITGVIVLFFAISGFAYLKINTGASEEITSSIASSYEDGIKSVGYKEITNYTDGFIAVGSGGRIDRISVSGKIIDSEEYQGENFNSLTTDNRLIVIAGDNGILRISTGDGMYRKVEIKSGADINSITFFKGIIIAGADKGIIISGNPDGSFNETQLNLKGNIVSVSSRITDCYGVTDAGEIIRSTDGIHWDITDFNLVYSGFYKHCYFTNVVVTENRIAVAGVNSDNLPVVMFSSKGTVWTERPLDYDDDLGRRVVLDELPNGLIFDDLGDQFFLLCNNGKILKLPSCSHCNELEVISSEDLEGMIFTEDSMVIVGENFLIRSISLR
jgi:hypothetical protein